MKNPTLLQEGPVEVQVHGLQYWMVLPDAATDYIQGLIAREHRPYEPELLDDMRRRVKAGDLVVDVGANVGNHALFMACIAGCRVAAFEPNVSLCEAIRASAALNNLADRVDVHVVGVGRGGGKARFEADLPANLGAQRLLLDGGDIEVVALDAVNLRGPVRMLKIDVEGMEIDVLEGAVELLRRDRPVVYVECIRERDFREVSRRVDALGYCYWETFNATPTHLFIPAESSEVEHRIGRLQSKQVEDEYRLAVLNKDVRNHAKQAAEREAALRGELLTSFERYTKQQLSALESVQAELRVLRQESETRAQVIDDLQRQLSAEQALSKAFADEAQAGALAVARLEDRLSAEQSRADASAGEAQALRLELEQAQRQFSSEQARAGALADERQRLQRMVDALTLRLETAERVRSDAVDRIDRLKAGVTFRTGQALIQATKSPQAMLKLPATLLRISRSRKAAPAKGAGARQALPTPARAHAAAPVTHQAEAAAGPSAPLPVARPPVPQIGSLRELRLAIVGNPDVAAGFARECRVVEASLDGDSGPQVLLIDASATQARRWATADGQPTQELAGLVQRCRELGVATLLWMHDIAVGPQHRSWAALVDHLFIADIEAIGEWRATLGHDRVHLLPSAVAGAEHNPLLRNPSDDGWGEVPLGGHDPQSPSDLPSAALAAIARHGVVASAYSHALRLMFGRLVISTDHAGERQRQVSLRRSDSEQDRKLRVVAQRKVHEEHGFAQRLATIAHSLTGSAAVPALPQLRVCAVAAPRDQAELDRVVDGHRRQARPAALLLVVGPADGLSLPDAPDVRRVDAMADTVQIAADFDAVAPLSARDYHGPHYLGDMTIASRWAPGRAVTRGPLFRAAPGGAIEHDDRLPVYQYTRSGSCRSSLVPATLWAQLAGQGLAAIDDATIDASEILAIDAFDYCQDAFVHGIAMSTLHARVDADAPAGMSGVSLAHLEALEPVFDPKAQKVAPALTLSPREWLARMPAAPDGITLLLDGDRVTVESRLEPAAYRYLYLSDKIPAVRLGTGDRICGLQGEAGRWLLFVLVFFDAQGKKLAHAMHAPGKEMPLELPAGTASVKLALRIEGPGSAQLGAMTASAQRPAPRPMVGSAQHLLISKQYPDYDDLYRFAFVHSRVRAYGRSGAAVDVLRLRPEPGRKHREFENVDVTEADLAHLDASLAQGMYDSLLVHFMDPPIWNVLRRHLDKVRVTVWVHGADVQPWWRRAGNYGQPGQRDKARNVTDERLATWRELFALDHPNLKVVFVSRKQADETLCDLDLDPDRTPVEVIHNFIDDELFAYHEKPAEQRLRILSVRPYASPVYANDLAVQAILHLAKRPVFDRLQFKLVGDGVLWEQTVAPLRDMPNVTLARGFVTQRDIAALHREYGVFLVPSRMDSQGVSRDEAMASGLVPVTTRVAAIPEFVDAECAMLCPPEDALALADAIEALANDPARFAAMSRAAAERVRRQSGREQTINRELALVARSLPQPAALKRFDRRIAVYGDLNLNILDGSAIWAASLAETLAGLPGTQVCLLLKARIQRTLVISRLLGLAPAVQIAEPALSPQQAMDPSQAVQRLVEMDAVRPFRAFVLRGLNLCATAAATPGMRGRIWAYLTDVPQTADALDAATRERIDSIAQACEFLLCQTPQMQAYLEHLFPSVRGRTRLLPPMVPALPDAAPRPARSGPLKLCYAGKFAANWGINELAHAFRELRRTTPDAELHIYGDKIHHVPSDPDFQSRTAKWLADTPGLVWHGAVDRDTLMRELPAMDLCWAYRDPRFEHGTLELSTKLLEYASLGVPMILTRSPVNESVLGRDYPLFVESAEEAQALLGQIARDRALLTRASHELGSVVSGYSFQAVRDRLQAQGLG